MRIQQHQDFRLIRRQDCNPGLSSENYSAPPRQNTTEKCPKMNLKTPQLLYTIFLTPCLTRGYSMISCCIQAPLPVAGPIPLSFLHLHPLNSTPIAYS